MRKKTTSHANRVSAILSENVAKELRRYCFENHMIMGAVIEEAIVEWLIRQEGVTDGSE